ncbi:Probable isochorismate synthase EntC [Mycobacteroides abscessus subsp. abscessus]|nr:Probable isochorismate synthase EntC [Mycobacteroides abscessus subsp. abscessus]
MLVGALPFDTSHPVALTAPVTVQRGLPQEFYGAMPNTQVAQQIPAPSEHLRRVTEAVEVLRSDAGLAKVVLARVLELRAESPVDPLVLTHRHGPTRTAPRVLRRNAEYSGDTTGTGAL